MFAFAALSGSHWKTAVFSQYPRPSDFPQINSDLPSLKDIKIMGYTMRTHLHRYTEWVGFDPVHFKANFCEVSSSFKIVFLTFCCTSSVIFWIRNR